MAVAQPGSVKIGDRVVILPQLPCGKCALCEAGDYVYCENSYDFEKFIGNKNGLGTFSQFVLKPDWLLPSIPDNVSDEHVTMAIDGIGASFGAFQSIDINAFDILLVTGLVPGAWGRR